MSDAIYCRVSTAQGDREVAGSVAQQTVACQNLARERGWTISPDLIFTEEISATSGAKRPAFDALCAAIIEGRIDRVVVWSTERVIRRMQDLERYVSVCEPRTVTTHPVVSTPLDLSNPTGLMVARITVAVAAFEVDQLKGRVKRGLQNRAEAGLPSGGRVPFGFLPDRITHHPVESLAINAATNAILAGDSVRNVARGWNEAGLTTRTGKPWSPSQVRTVLARPRNAGLVQRHGVAGTRAVWEPIVTVDRWRALCALLADPKRRTSPGGQPRWLLSFIARCECGEYMRTWRSGYDRNRKVRVAYRCSVIQRTEPHATVPADDADALLADSLVFGFWQMGVGFPTTVVTPDPVSQTDQLADIARRRSEQIALYDDGLLTLDEYRASLARLTLRAEQTSPTPETVLTAGADSIDALRAEWDAFPIDRRRAIVRDSVDIIIHRSGPGQRVPVEDRLTLRWKITTGEV